MIIENFVKGLDVVISQYKNETDDYIEIGIYQEAETDKPGHKTRKGREIIIKSTEFGVKLFVENIDK